MSVRRHRLAVVVAVGLVVMVLSPLARVAVAQSRNWSQPYEAGLDDIKKQKWADAIQDLTKAIALDPKAQANKHIEGTYYEDYFPFYYRGLAYMHAGNAAKAEEDFQVALRTKMPDPLTLELKRRQAQLVPPPASQPSTPPPATPVEPPKTEPAKPEPPKPDAPKPPAGPDPRVQAASLVKDGNALVSQGKLAQAQTDFQEALKLAAQTPGAQDGLSAITARRAQYDSAKKAAATARQSGQTADAVTNLQKAKAADPEQYAVDQLDAQLQAVTREGAALRMAKSGNLLNAGRELARQHLYTDAEAKYQEAVDADATNAAAADALRRSQAYDTSVRDGRAMFAQANWQGARVQLADAQSLDADRFKADGLESTLAEIGRREAGPGRLTAPSAGPAAAPPAPVVRPPLHDALVAFLDGQITDAIHLLEPMAASDSAYDALGRASIHGYLGVAYATNALEERADDARANWRRKAIKEFQLAEAAQPGFQLSDRVVSPAIQAIVHEAKKKY